MPTYTDALTGRQVTSATPLSEAQIEEAFAPTPESLRGFAQAEATRQGVRPELVLGVLNAESGAKASAVSPKGATGPMQLMPGTAKDLGVDPTNPWQNIQGGIRYLRQQLDAHQGDETLALASYNAGPGNVQKYGGVPPFSETQNYIAKIQRATAPGPRPIPMDPPFLESQRYEPGGPIERQQGGPALAGASQVIAPLMLPVGSTIPRAMAWGGTGAVLSDAIGLARERGIDAINPDTLKRLGMDFLIGGAVAGAIRLGTDLVFGRPQPARRAAEAVFPEPPPVIGAQTEEGRQPFLERVNQAFRNAVRPVDDEAVTAAYNDFRATAGNRPIDVTAYNKVLARYEDQVLPGLRLPAQGRTFAPVGREGARDALLTGIPAKTVASVDEIIASDKGINLATRMKNPDGSSSLPGGMMIQLKKELKAALDASLTPDEQAAYRGAQALAAKQARMDDAVALLTGTNENGLPRPDKVFRLLDDDKTGKYLDQLGPELHDQVKRIAAAGKTLMQHPLGRRVFAQFIARIPGMAAGAALGSAAGGLSAAGGAVVGTALSPQASLLSPTVLQGLETLARHRAGSEAFSMAAGRLAVALALDQSPPPPDPRRTAQPLPMLPTPTRTARPLGAVGAP